MDAEKPPHTSLFILQENPSIQLVLHTVACNPQSRLNAVLSWSLHIYFPKTTLRNFRWKTPRQYENRRGMASAWGPGSWIKAMRPPKDESEWALRTDRQISVSELRGGGRRRAKDSVAIHVPGCVKRFLHWCMVVEQEELLEIFRRLVYKLVFTQYALFPQPSLRQRRSDRLRPGFKRRIGNTV